MADNEKASIKEIKAYFEAGDGPKVGMQELKDLKTSNGGADYDQIAYGLGNGSETY